MFKKIYLGTTKFGGQKRWGHCPRMPSPVATGLLTSTTSKPPSLFFQQSGSVVG